MVAVSSQDLKALIRHTLMQDTAVHAIVGGRIHGAHIQDPDSKSVVYPMVIIEFEGGHASPSSTFQQVTFYLYAYHRDSAGDAIRLYDACFAALHHQLLRRDGIAMAGYAMETVRPEDGWNEKARAYWAQGLLTARGSYRSNQ